MAAMTAVSAIYSDEYADRYDDLYLTPWPNKHRWNVATITRLLSNSGDTGGWLDLCCGQAWHFSQFPRSVFKLGIDLSSAQLHRAARRNPEASFVQGDVLRLPLVAGRFGLVTCFWAAYCYLDSEDRIATFIDDAVAATRDGGAVYIEVLLPEMLESFNRSAFARQSTFRVADRGGNFTRWSYTDGGGEHRMTSPPLEFFLSRLRRRFRTVTAQHDKGFMYHVVASGKGDPGCWARNATWSRSSQGRNGLPVLAR